MHLRVAASKQPENLFGVLSNFRGLDLWASVKSKEGKYGNRKNASTNRRRPRERDPKHYTVEFENDRVRVVRIKYKPGEKSVMHSHPESVAVFLTDAHSKFTYPDGKSEDIKAKAGSVQHMDAFTHLPENTSKKPFEVIQVELKG